jgi:hypothetical protein
MDVISGVLRTFPGEAEGGNSSNSEDDAFVSAKDAVAGSQIVTTDHFQNTCIREVFYTFIDADLSRVRSLTGSDDDEHSLGEITSTEDPTYCTDESLETTAEDGKNRVAHPNPKASRTSHFFTFRVIFPTRKHVTNMDRRHFLSAAGGVLVSGCFAGGTPDTASPTVRGPSTGSADHLGDFILWNDDDEQHTLSVTVEGGGDVFRDTNRTLSPGSSGGISNRIDR